MACRRAICCASVVLSSFPGLWQGGMFACGNSAHHWKQQVRNLDPYWVHLSSLVSELLQNGAILEAGVMLGTGGGISTSLHQLVRSARRFLDAPTVGRYDSC